MPTSIESLEKKFNLKYEGCYQWGSSFINSGNGIYIISQSKDKGFLPKANLEISFNANQMDAWLRNAPNILLHGLKPSIQDLKRQLKGFWLPDESILYIGKAEKQTLSERICQFYNHKVGKKSPHKGGYWLKLLINLDELHVHLYSTKDSHKVEEKLLKFFIANVSEKSRKNLIDRELCLPFANLQLRSRVIKNHGFKNHYQ
jgi:hypothetical protein